MNVFLLIERLINWARHGAQAGHNMIGRMSMRVVVMHMKKGTWSDARKMLQMMDGCTVEGAEQAFWRGEPRVGDGDHMSKVAWLVKMTRALE